MVRELVILVVVFLVATFPATWLLMLFLGNLGLGLSYVGTLPLGVLVSSLLGAVGSRRNSERPLWRSHPRHGHQGRHGTSVAPVSSRELPPLSPRGGGWPTTSTVENGAY